MDDTEIKVANENQQAADGAKNAGKAEGEFEFVTETIKKKPINKKKICMKIISGIGMGILIGLIACIVFVYFAPKFYSKIYPEQLDEVSIPEDVIDENEYQEDAPINIDKVTETVPEETEEVTEVPEEAVPEEKITHETVINQIVEQKEMGLDDYKLLYRKIAEVANDASRYLATVTAVTDETDWFMNTYETGNQTNGIIIADNGKELLIITNMPKINDAKEIEVTFCNGNSYTGTVKKSDSETGLAVVAVELESLSDATKNSIVMAELGNSTVNTIVGSPIIAVGSPLGISDSIATGEVTSNKHVLDLTDSNLRYITTDIYGSTSGSGVIIDLEGKVIGIIFQGGTTNDTKNLIHAYAISDIKGKIEKMSNGRETAYLGIKGTDVTESISTELGVPMGAYVTQVIVDSPAMKEGIQNGDVIVKLGTNEIKSFKDYKDVMQKSQPGDLVMITVKRPSKDGYIEIPFEITLGTLQ